MHARPLSWRQDADRTSSHETHTSAYRFLPPNAFWYNALSPWPHRLRQEPFRTKKRTGIHALSFPLPQLARTWSYSVRMCTRFFHTIIGVATSVARNCANIWSRSWTRLWVPRFRPYFGHRLRPCLDERRSWVRCWGRKTSLPVQGGCYVRKSTVGA